MYLRRINFQRNSVSWKWKSEYFANKNLVIMAAQTAVRLKTKLLRPKLCLPFWLMAKNPHGQIGPRFAQASVYIFFFLFCLFLASALAPNHMPKLQSCRPGVAQSRLRCCIISYNLWATAKWKSQLNSKLQMGSSIARLHLGFICKTDDLP